MIMVCLAHQSQPKVNNGYYDSDDINENKYYNDGGNDNDGDGKSDNANDVGNEDAMVKVILMRR